MQVSEYNEFVKSLDWERWQIVNVSHLRRDVKDAELHRVRFLTIINIIEDYCQNVDSFRVADIGCYPGVFGTILKHQFKNIVLDGVGLGLSDEFKNKTKDIYEAFCEAELDPLYPQRYREDVPPNKISVPDSTYDLLIASEIFEHLYNPLHFVKEMSRILKKDGIMILSTPNICYIGNIFRLLAGKSIYEELKTSHIFMDNDWRPHMRVYDRNEIRTLMEYGAFKEEKVLMLDNRENHYLSNGKMKLKMLFIRLLYIFPRFRNQYIGVFRKQTV